MESFEYRGYWWLPESPEHKVAGTLKFEPSKSPELQLFGILGEDKYSKFPMSTEIILGVTMDSKPVTLFDCMERARPVSSSTLYPISQVQSVVIAGTVFINAALSARSEARFTKMFVSFINLDEWSRIRGETWQANTATREINPYPKEATASLEDVAISIKHDFSFKGGLFKKTVEQKSGILIETATPTSFDVFKEYIYTIQVFLSLGIGAATYPASIHGQMQHQDYPVSIHYPLAPSLLEASKAVMQHNMFFIFSDIVEVFERCLSNWFTKKEILEPVYNLYHYTLSSPLTPIEQEFLNIAQAIEAYHRRLYGGKYVTDEEYSIIYEHLIAQLPENTPNDLRQKLEKYLIYGNEYSLRKRFKEIWRRHGEVLIELFQEKSAYEGFYDIAIKIRDYLTHYTEDEEAEQIQQIIESDEMFPLTMKLRALLEVCLLSELGLPREKVNEIVRRNRYYNFFF